MVSCKVSAADEEIVVRRGEALAYHRAHADEDASESDAGGARVMGGGTPSLVCHRDEMKSIACPFFAKSTTICNSLQAKNAAPCGNRLFAFKPREKAVIATLSAHFYFFLVFF